jgi:hypothetical protein
MSSQLDILALEPFFGGVRRIVLDNLIRCSRHRWTLLKLPPRRIERRLTAAAHWFSEQLLRHWVGRVDVIFTSEALNLADFFRLSPQLVGKPSVVYFHANQLPPMTSPGDGPLDLVNLNTAMAATEIWFNSRAHLEDFYERAATLVERHPELSSRSPIPDLIGKTKLMSPPIDVSAVREFAKLHPVAREKRTIFVDTRDADLQLLNAALSTLQRRKTAFSLVTIGPVDSLDASFPRRTIAETDVESQVTAMLQSPVFLSTKLNNPFDPHAVRALAAGCWMLLPKSGAYPEIVPPQLHTQCLYTPTADHLSSKLMDVWSEEIPTNFPSLANTALKPFDSITACKAIDERLEQLAATRKPDHSPLRFADPD